MILLLLFFIIHIIFYSFFPYPKKPNKSHTYSQIIILGCPCLEDGRLSDSQRRRIEAAIFYYQNDYAKSIIVSGGGVKNSNVEALCMAEELRIQLPNAHILIEDKARNTYQNMKNVQALYPNDDVLIVSGSSHLRRSYFFARKFYQHSTLGYGKKKDPFHYYIWEYTRMWVALYWEIHLHIKKQKG